MWLNVTSFITLLLKHIYSQIFVVTKIFFSRFGWRNRKSIHHVKPRKQHYNKYKSNITFSFYKARVIERHSGSKSDKSWEKIDNYAVIQKEMETHVILESWDKLVELNYMQRDIIVGIKKKNAYKFQVRKYKYFMRYKQNQLSVLFIYLFILKGCFLSSLTIRF